MIRTYLVLALSGLCAAIGFATVSVQAENTRCGESLDRRRGDILRLKERNTVNGLNLLRSQQDREFEV